jgi:hypothetical protein
MVSVWLRTAGALAAVAATAVGVQGCKGPDSAETVIVYLRNTETYQYRTVGGDEEGATISVQAAHYSISEIRRDAATNWYAVYVYQPAPGFVGEDHAEIEVQTGSDGASAPTNIKRIVFRFSIHD